MIPTDEVEGALARLLESDHFVHAGRLSNFLRFVVKKTLAGQGAELKEYLIGTEVFGRPPQFDPRVDPVVRVEARRLRAKLQEYYEDRGRKDPIRITLRKGGYVPGFEPASVAEAVPPEAVAPVSSEVVTKRKWAAAAGALLLSAILAVLLAGRTAVHGWSPKAVSILVVPWAEAPDQQGFSDGLAEAVNVELAHDSQWPVVPWTRFVEYRRSHGGPGTMKLSDAARELGAEIVLAVDARRRGPRREIVAFITKAGQESKEWAGEYERDTTDEFSVQRELARSIAEDARARLR